MSSRPTFTAFLRGLALGVAALIVEGLYAFFENGATSGGRYAFVIPAGLVLLRTLEGLIADERGRAT